MINYRKATKSDTDACIKLLGKSFKDYTYMNIYTTSEEKQEEFITALYATEFKVALKNSDVILAEENGEILSVAVLNKPFQKESTLFDYLLNSGFDIIKVGGLRNSLCFLNMLQRTGKACHDLSQKHSAWYLDFIAVADCYKGQGIGSKMIQDAIIPHIKKHNGHLLTLITNSKNNYNFYKKNGFKDFFYEKLSFNNVELDNWSFQLSL